MAFLKVNRTALRNLTTILLFGAAFALSLRFVDKSNTVPFVIDILEYQSIAVNFASGHGLQRFGGLEGFDKYRFDLYENDPELPTSSMLFELFVEYAGIPHFYMDPGYPLFMGTIYACFGVKPYLVKVFQLLLLCVTCFSLPHLLFRYWNRTGYVIGLVAGGILFITNFHYVNRYMTEVLNLFSFALILLAFQKFEKKSNDLNSVLLGCTLAFSLTIKGVAALVPVFLMALLLIRSYRSKNPVIVRGIVVSSASMLFALSPWVLYSNHTNRHIDFDRVEFETSLLDTQYCYACKDYVESSKLTEEEKSYLIDRNFNLQTTRVKGVKSITEFDYFIVDLFAEILSDRSLFFINKKHEQIFLTTNNEYLAGLDKKPHLWKKEPTSFYNNDGLSNSPELYRVLNFYLHNPKTLLLNVSHKLFYFLQHPRFLILIIWIFVLHTLTEYFGKLLTRKAFWRIARTLGVLISVILFTTVEISPYLEAQLGSFNELNSIVHLCLLIILGSWSFLVSVKYKTSSYAFFRSIPLSFLAIFLNLLFVGIVIISIPRFTDLLNLVTIPTFLLYVRFLASNYLIPIFTRSLV